ncbi:MAG TPA: type II toxin-antitoxin system RelE/ParE family toxin [Candidatus Omnitrophota bacterium]|nr:type II toxin-antitoxin system RelE/ParE family toxin [Candidatus Omnitrophota bacterium]
MKRLSLKEQFKIVAYFNELRIQGHNLRRPMADYIGDGIYELRPRHNRIFYFFFLRDNVILLHAIRKKTDSIPQGDLDLCLKRKQLVEQAEGHIERID